MVALGREGFAAGVALGSYHFGARSGDMYGGILSMCPYICRCSSSYCLLPDGRHIYRLSRGGGAFVDGRGGLGAAKASFNIAAGTGKHFDGEVNLSIAE